MQIRSQLQVSAHHGHIKINKKTLSAEKLTMAPASTRKIASNWHLYLLPILLPFVLSGCVTKSLSETLNPEPEPPVVKQKTIDYRWAECKTLSAFYDEGINNALYWLRTIECTNRIMTTEAQRQASRVVVTGWDNAFYKSILLERAGMTIAERRTQLVLLESYKLQFPSSMRVLLSTWIENQTLILSLAEEKNRYRRFSTETENRIELLKKENVALEHELKITLKKLENLTQIERQLSSRKQGTSVDTLSSDSTLSEAASTSAENNSVENPTTTPPTTAETTVEKSAEAASSTQSITVDPQNSKPQADKPDTVTTAAKPEPSKPEQVKTEPAKVGTDKPATEKPTEAGSK
ncbi:two-component system QseEF-associated lipoprotein QseG [Proteus hauseri]|uniref:two-component system QseEF-associated lipoprotein QseG n=1 Tax=Proteus hauseri TaxID=183417 RepID=UPI0032DB386B